MFRIFSRRRSSAAFLMGAATPRAILFGVVVLGAVMALRERRS